MSRWAGFLLEQRRATVVIHDNCRLFLDDCMELGSVSCQSSVNCLIELELRADARVSGKP